MPELNYHHLRYFRIVAHEGHLTRAAQRLNVSQSALSVQIRLLEARLGQPLFERTGRSLHLTEAGRIALDHADTIFSTGDELVETLKQSGRNRKAIRIGALATLSRNFQIGFLKPLLGRADVEIVLRSGSAAELFGALSALQVDLVLANQAPAIDALSGYIVQPIAQQSVALVGRPELVGPRRKLAELLATKPLILPSRISGIRVAFDALTERLRVRPQIAAEIDDMAMMRLLAREGVGLAVIPPIVVRDELKTGHLKVAGKIAQIMESFFAVTLKRKFPNPLIRDLLFGSA
ncbi:MAG: LysR family transcriptional regulator [Alphaproteobacteria bacterium]|nr:LysR family transcriptional regulator [Alphaproteobacteria bacterium]